MHMQWFVSLGTGVGGLMFQGGSTKMDSLKGGGVWKNNRLKMVGTKILPCGVGQIINLPKSTKISIYIDISKGGVQKI